MLCGLTVERALGAHRMHSVPQLAQLVGPVALHFRRCLSARAMSSWGPKWCCRAKASPDCIESRGPVCKACEMLVDDDWMEEIKKAFNDSWPTYSEKNSARFCETPGCEGLVKHCNWDARRRTAYMADGGPIGHLDASLWGFALQLYFCVCLISSGGRLTF